MRTVYILIAAAGLALLLVPPLLFYHDHVTEERMKMLMFIGTLVWFAGASPWLGKKKEET